MRGPAPDDRIQLTGSERRHLRRQCRQRTREHRFVQRRQIVLLAADGLSNTAISVLLGVCRDTVFRWRHQYAILGEEGLEERPRPGRPPRLTPQERHEVVALACRDPKDFGVAATHWSIRSLTQAVISSGRVQKISQTAVGTILRGADIHPHRFRMWLFSKDPRFDEKMRDIVELYTVVARRGETVLSIDEKTSIQALERVAPTLRPRIGQSGRFEFEYIRHGTTCLFACFNVGTGRVLGWCNPTRTQIDFLAYLDRVADLHPNGRVHLVLDNLNTHTSQDVTAWNRRHGNRFQIHFTPTHASWLNQVEIWFSLLHKQCLKLGNFYDVEHLELMIHRYIDSWNLQAHPFKWTWKGFPLQRGLSRVAPLVEPRHIHAHDAQDHFVCGASPRQQFFEGSFLEGRTAARAHRPTASLDRPLGAQPRLSPHPLA